MIFSRLWTVYELAFRPDKSRFLRNARFFNPEVSRSQFNSD